MKLIKIDINNYKSIASPVSVNFQDGLPTVLIGKNGSGKSNLLEALEHIASTNANLPGKHSAGGLQYKAHIRLEKDEFAKLFPSEEYSEEKATFAACSSSKDTLHIDTIESESIVPLLKKELVDIRAVANELIAAIETYEKALQKIAYDDRDALSLRGYELTDGKGNTTNCEFLKSRASLFADQVKRMSEVYADGIKTDNSFVFSNYHFGIGNICSLDTELVPFKLKYTKPELAPFEQKFITINETAIKCEITKINKKTEDSRQKIDELISKLKAQSERLMDTDPCGAITEFLRKVRHIFGGNCGYLLNESNQVLFKDLRRENDNRYYDPSRVVFEAYAKANNKPKLLGDKEHKLSDAEIKEFEEWLNSNRPTFDEGMYKSITVSLGEKNELVIKLEENNGQIVSLNKTSAGRRWYFTYYFVKCTLSEGDTFIIDEPASMLHPSAQKEILIDLLDLSRKGIRVVYSTHSPYLIPQEWNCVGFVSMEDETIVSYIDAKLERNSLLKSVIGDVFNLESVVVEFQKNPQKIAENCYQVIKEKDKSLEMAATELNVSVDTIKSWHRRGDHFRSPKLENVISVATYADISIEALLK
ncbi:MAG: AAA family ATPase [Clostridia bacterium]|nr:AAA family ATPase [Clostridia bacterium]